MNNKDNIQEKQYSFPYHYIPRVENGKFLQYYNLNWGFEYLMYLEFIKHKIKNLNFDSICDIGCGDGRLMNDLSNELDEDITIYGVDKSEQAIQFAKIFNKNNRVRFTTQLNNKEAFDVVTCIEVLEHIPLCDVEAFIEYLQSKIHKGGYLILTVPSNNLAVNKKHYRHYSLDDLKIYFNYNSYFKIVEQFYLLKNNLLRHLFFKMFTNKLFILKSNKFTNYLFSIYKRYQLLANERTGRKIFVLMEKL